MDEALLKSGQWPNIALTPGTNRHAATGEVVEIPTGARVDSTCDSDAVAFCKRVERAAKERKPLTLFGVNYEAVGNVPFCEQAVAATLGTPERTCHIEERYIDWYCDACFEMVGTCDTTSELFIDGNAIKLWNYCPNCGRKVEQ